MNSVIILEHKEADGNAGKYELFLSETFSLLHGSDIVSIELPNKWMLIIKFIDDPIEKSESRMIIKDNNITVTLINWDHEYWQENLEPFYVGSADNEVATKLYVKIRTSTLKNKSIRNVSISIWRKI